MKCFVLPMFALALLTAVPHSPAPNNSPLKHLTLQLQHRASAQSRTSAPTPMPTPTPNPALNVTTVQFTNGLWWLPISLSGTISILLVGFYWRPKQGLRQLVILILVPTIAGALVTALLHLLMPKMSLVVDTPTAEFLAAVYGGETALILGVIGVRAVLPKSNRAIGIGIILLAVSISFLTVNRLVLEHIFSQLSGDGRQYYLQEPTFGAASGDHKSPQGVIYNLVHIGVRPYYVLNESNTVSVQLIPNVAAPAENLSANSTATIVLKIPSCAGALHVSMNAFAFNKTEANALPMDLPPKPQQPAHVWRWMINPQTTGRQVLEFTGNLTEGASRNSGCHKDHVDSVFDITEEMPVWRNLFDIDQSTKVLAIITTLIGVLSTVYGLLVRPNPAATVPAQPPAESAPHDDHHPS